MLVIVGGGAAGLLAALRAGALGVNATVLEATREVGRKVLISGGGRCNVLPMRDAPERFVSSSPNRLVRRFLDRVPLPAQRDFFEELLGAPLREEPEALKLFPPSNRSKDVRDALRRRAEAAGATIRTSAPVRSLERRGDGFLLTLDGQTLDAEAVIVTTGGLSVLGGGADAKGLDWAAAMGHTVVAPYAALAPLVAEGAPHAALSGLSLPARLTARAAGESAISEGGFLFTHRGYSGPSALDVSHVVERHGPAARVTARFGGDVDWDAELRAGAGTVASFLRKRFPDRLADLLLRVGSPTGVREALELCVLALAIRRLDQDLLHRRAGPDAAADVGEEARQRFHQAIGVLRELELGEEGIGLGGGIFFLNAKESGVANEL